MTWDVPWNGVPFNRIMYLKMSGGHLEILSTPQSLAQLPGTDRDKAAFQCVAVRYTRLMKQVRLWHMDVCVVKRNHLLAVVQCMHTATARPGLPVTACDLVWAQRVSLPPRPCVQCWAANHLDRPKFATITQQLT